MATFGENFGQAAGTALGSAVGGLGGIAGGALGGIIGGLFKKKADPYTAQFANYHGTPLKYPSQFSDINLGNAIRSSYNWGNPVAEQYLASNPDFGNTFMRMYNPQVATHGFNDPSGASHPMETVDQARLRTLQGTLQSLRGSGPSGPGMSGYIPMG